MVGDVSERIVEAQRLLLISNEELERLDNRIESLQNSDFKAIFSSAEFSRRCGGLVLQNIRLPVQPSTLPEEQDMHFVLAARDITPRREFFEVIQTAKSLRLSTDKESIQRVWNDE